MYVLRDYVKTEGLNVKARSKAYLCQKIKDYKPITNPRESAIRKLENAKMSEIRAYANKYDIHAKSRKDLLSRLRLSADYSSGSSISSSIGL